MRKYLNGTNVPLSVAVFLATDLTQDILKEWLSYDPTTGIFTWVKRASNRVPPGQRAGYQSKGYCQIRLAGHLYYAHRLAFLYMTGSFPSQCVDHINGNTTDDSWVNLREVSVQENQKNTAIAKNNTSGVTGVVWDKRNEKWMARIHLNYKTHFIGYYSDFPDAVAARKAAELQHHFHPNHGRPIHA